MSETARTVVKNAFLKGYDRAMVKRVADVYYDNSGFFNFGYWQPETKTQREASENLINHLLVWLPEKKGTILDVACGMGASTRMLLDYYPPENVYAVNLSEAQVGLSAGRAPGCGFAVMDAARLGFAGESFDNIICVEAAFHFTTRADFFREAYRLLKPGGRLVHTDLLNPPDRSVVQNYLPSPEGLTKTLQAAGFNEVEVLDRTNECIGGVGRHMKAWPGEARKARSIKFGEYVVASAFSVVFRRVLKRRYTYYLLSTARKPLS